MKNINLILTIIGNVNPGLYSFNVSQKNPETEYEYNLTELNSMFTSGCEYKYNYNDTEYTCDASNNPDGFLITIDYLDSYCGLSIDYSYFSLNNGMIEPAFMTKNWGTYVYNKNIHLGFFVQIYY